MVVAGEVGAPGRWRTVVRVLRRPVSRARGDHLGGDGRQLVDRDDALDLNEQALYQAKVTACLRGATSSSPTKKRRSAGVPARRRRCSRPRSVCGGLVDRFRVVM